MAKKCPKWLRTNALTLATMIGVFAGVGLGFLLRMREGRWSQREAMYVSFVGEIFLRMLKCLIMPLIVSSLISSVGGLDLSMSRKIGLRAIGFYTLTLALAVVLGMVLVCSIQPGKTMGGGTNVLKADGGRVRNVTTPDVLLDLVRNVFPPNLVQAAVFTYRTYLIPPPAQPAANSSIGISDTGNSSAAANASAIPKQPSIYDWGLVGKYDEGTNVLGLVVFSFILGLTVCKMEEKGKPLFQFFSSLAEGMMLITNWVIWLSPIGVMSLVAGQLVALESVGAMVGQLGFYFLTVVLGLFIHGFIVLPTLYGLVTRTLPFRFILNMSDAMATAFGTASSAATLPVTFRCLEDNNKIDSRLVRFILPIGASINMDGTALYEAVAAIYLSQVRGMHLSIGAIIATSVSATVVCMGAAGIPQAGLVTLLIVMDTIGLPPEDVTFILAVDWLLDRFRTTVNVLGDSFGAGVVAHISAKDMPPVDTQNVESSDNSAKDGNLVSQKTQESEILTFNPAAAEAGILNNDAYSFRL